MTFKKRATSAEKNKTETAEMRNKLGKLQMRASQYGQKALCQENLIRQRGQTLLGVLFLLISFT
jgi:hypothetical protein